MGWKFAPVLWLLVNLAIVVTSVYVLFLVIKLMHKGIKALNIYINEKSNNDL